MPVVSSAAGSARLRSLYRDILREAQRFPSIKRATLVEDIRAEWRAGSSAVDATQVAQRIEVALRGLETLRKYTRLDYTSATWQVHLEQDPMGMGHHSRGGLTEPSGVVRRGATFIPFGSANVGKLS